LLTTIDSARMTFPKLPLVFGFGHALVMIFIWPFIGINISDEFLPSAIIGLAIGLIMGIFLKYRAKFSVKLALVSSIYLVILLSYLSGFSGLVAAIKIAGINRNKGMLFFIYFLFIAIPFVFGILNHLVKLKFFGKNSSDWMNAMKEVVDFEKYIIYPSKFTQQSSATNLSAAVWSASAMAANIPLLFQFFTGDRNNVIFFVIPIFIGVFAYLNVKTFGPQIASLYLLRRYEKQTHRHFINADYEKIQELRRTFFLSRWLMKDYRKDYRPASNHAPLSTPANSPKRQKPRQKQPPR
jgi:hypothetical protein